MTTKRWGYAAYFSSVKPGEKFWLSNPALTPRGRLVECECISEGRWPACIVGGKRILLKPSDIVYRRSMHRIKVGA